MPLIPHSEWPSGLAPGHSLAELDPGCGSSSSDAQKGVPPTLGTVPRSSLTVPPVATHLRHMSRLITMAGQVTEGWTQTVPAFGGSHVTHLAAHLTQRWDQSLWGRLERLVAEGGDMVVRAPRPVTKPRQHQTRIAPAQVTALVADYRAGASIAELTRRYNIHYETAARWLALNNVAVRPREHCIPKTALPHITELRQAGWSWVKIAAQYDCTGRALSKAYARLSAQAARES